MRQSLVSQHDIGEDERARNRILARESSARVDCLMGVERRLDLFWVNLGAANIDDAAAPADKIEPVAAPLNHVAGIDEAVLANERGGSGAKKPQSATIRSHAKRAVDDLHPDGAASFEPRLGKACFSVINRED